MKRFEFDQKQELVKKMFHVKEISNYVEDVIFDEVSMIPVDLYLAGCAQAAAAGCRYTPENILAGIEKARKKLPKVERIKTDCSRCGGDGAVIANSFAYSCTCDAGINYPSFPKYNGQKDKELTITKTYGSTIREFYGYSVKVPNNVKSVSEISFEHTHGLVKKITRKENTLKPISSFLGE